MVEITRIESFKTIEDFDDSIYLDPKFKAFK